MEDPTLQQVLKNNYGVTEKIWAEGMFILLIGNSKSAKSLLSIGLGQKNLYIAKVVLSGPVIDFELKYLTPLSLVSISYDNTMKMLTVKNKFKATKVYQLCTSQFEENVWDDFTGYIRYIGVNKLPEVWIEQQLTAVPSVKDEVVCVDVDAFLLSEFYSVSTHGCQRINKNQTMHQTTGHNQATRSVSLPALLPFAADDMPSIPLIRRHSMDCVDIKFDSFVNDAPTRFSEFNGSYTTCSWTGSADDLARLHTEKFKVNNTAHPSSTENCHSPDAVEKEGFFAKLKGVFSFKKSLRF